jgi:hypothetical protein
MVSPAGCAFFWREKEPFASERAVADYHAGTVVYDNRANAGRGPQFAILKPGE